MARCLQLAISVLLAGIAMTMTHATDDETQAKQDVFTSKMTYKTDQLIQEGRRVLWFFTMSHAQKQNKPHNKTLENGLGGLRKYPNLSVFPRP